MDVSSLLILLSDGNFHSGSELGASLGVSRAAIWKALKRLADFNLDIETIKGKGYRLRDGIELLDSRKIKSGLSDTIRAQLNIDLMLSIDSTNRYLMDSLIEHSKPYAVCLAEMQTSGRGRRDRAWVSPFGKNIYLSIGFDLPGGAEALNGLSLVVGIAVVRALRSQGVVDAMLKWPNDIWVNSRKVAGILVELQGEATTGWRVIVGIGINIEMTQDEGEGIDQPWTAVSEYVSCSRNKMVVALLENLIDVFTEFRSNGFEAFLAEWQQCDFLHEKKVVLSNTDANGIAKGVDAFGALQVDTGSELISVNAGDVSVRPQ